MQNFAEVLKAARPAVVIPLDSIRRCFLASAQNLRRRVFASAVGRRCSSDRPDMGADVPHSIPQDSTQEGWLLWHRWMRPKAQSSRHRYCRTEVFHQPPPKTAGRGFESTEATTHRFLSDSTYPTAKPWALGLFEHKSITDGRNRRPSGSIGSYPRCSSVSEWRSNRLHTVG